MADRAKELFLSYEGNHYAMANDGVYEEYKSFNISKSQENMWMKVILESQIDSFLSSEFDKTKFVKLCSLARKNKDIALLQRLYDVLFSENIKSETPVSQLYIFGAFVDAVNYFGFVDGIKERYRNGLYNAVSEIEADFPESEVIKRAESIKARM